MITKMYTIYDAAAKCYLPCFFFQQDGEAIRAFKNMANDKSHQFCINADDFTLFVLGQFDNETAQLDTYPTPVSMGTALEHSNEIYAKLTKEEK